MKSCLTLLVIIVINMYRKLQEVSISAGSIENPFKFDGIMNAEKRMSDFL